LVLLGQRVLLEQPDPQVRLAQPDLKVLKAHKAQLAQPDLKVLKAHKA
jgi:hypothetical protein